MPGRTGDESAGIGEADQLGGRCVKRKETEGSPDAGQHYECMAASPSEVWVAGCGCLSWWHLVCLSDRISQSLSEC